MVQLSVISRRSYVNRAFLSSLRIRNKVHRQVQKSEPQWQQLQNHMLIQIN